MAPVLSFIHVVIVHINVHHPSYTNYYRACPDWRPGLHHLPIPQTVYMPGPLHHCQIILFVTGRGCSPRSIHPLGGTATANCAPLFKELPCSSERQPELVLVNAPESECLHRRGKPSHFHWHLTSSNCCRLIYQGLKKKKHSGETVGWPASTASIKARVLWKPEDSESTGHPLTTQRVTYAKN